MPYLNLKKKVFFGKNNCYEYVYCLSIIMIVITNQLCNNIALKISLYHHLNILSVDHDIALALMVIWGLNRRGEGPGE